jgi:iron complex outermembrane recepter protein
VSAPPLQTALVAVLASAFAAHAQMPPPVSVTDTVVITAERARQSSFDAPAAISAVTREVIDAGGPQINLSEALNRVPGITVLNRQNYAQDLQLSIRGFGSRSTFGIRGVRLIVDGIPATMPDGQGQASNIALTSVERIEVLRGPLAQLYGNAAGGVVQVVTGSDATRPTTTLRTAVGRDGLVKYGLTFAANGATDEVLLDASQFHTDGWREHSRAERTQLNAKLEHRFGADSRIRLIFNSLDQPVSLDPLGLMRAQWEANPKQAVAAAKSQDARKSVAQDQLGVVFEHALTEATQLTARLYSGTRSLDNALAILPQFQAPATASGGIVAFERSYSGVGATVSHRIALGGTRALRLTAGVDLDRMVEDRRGYLNNAGVQGALKRNEHNTVDNRDAFAQAAWEAGGGLTASAGVRASRVRFRSQDHFIEVGNPDDSGGVDYGATNPVLGIAWRASPALNLYANAGQGFETPTFTELAYRPPCPATAPPAQVPCLDTGLNTDLRASRGRHAELGAKWKPTSDQRIDVAIFEIRTTDEIVVDTNNGGRSTFKNVGRTRRRGAELQYTGALGSDWRATLALTALRATFRDNFTSGSGAAAVPVPAGNRLPGTPDRSAFAELAYAPPRAWAGFNAAVEVVHSGRLYVNDANEDSAPASTVVNLRAGLAQTVGEWTFSELLRIDNATDRRYAGSVIVNEANRRFFEPAPPRGALLALTVKYAYR